MQLAIFILGQITLTSPIKPPEPFISVTTADPNYGTGTSSTEHQQQIQIQAQSNIHQMPNSPPQQPQSNSNAYKPAHNSPRNFFLSRGKQFSGKRNERNEQIDEQIDDDHEDLSKCTHYPCRQTKTKNQKKKTTNKQTNRKNKKTNSILTLLSKSLMPGWKFHRSIASISISLEFEFEFESVKGRDSLYLTQTNIQPVFASFCGPLCHLWREESSY